MGKFTMTLNETSMVCFEGTITSQGNVKGNNSLVYKIERQPESRLWARNASGQYHDVSWKIDDVNVTNAGGTSKSITVTLNGENVVYIRID